MTIKYIIHNGDDYGVLPNSMEVHLTIKSDEGKGYSELKIKFPFKWDLIKWKTGDICSVITEEGTNFFLFTDFKIQNVYTDFVILTSKHFVDFQPIFKLGTQI